MKLTNRILLLLGNIIICSCSNNEVNNKIINAEKIKSLDSLNKKIIPSVDSITIHPTVYINSSITNKLISKIDSIGSDPFDLLLLCGEYSYFPNKDGSTKSYFGVPYNGCVYNPKYYPNNKLGWAQIILIPKVEYESQLSNISRNSIDSIEKTINSMSINQLKNKFIPIIFLIESKYLFYKENAEINFYPKLPYLKKLVIYKNDLKKWVTTDSIKVQNELEDGKWMDKVINKFN